MKVISERLISMTPQNISRTRKFLVTAIVASILIIGAVTALYDWKGLSELRSKSDPDRGYYVTY